MHQKLFHVRADPNLKKMRVLFPIVHRNSNFYLDCSLIK